MYEHVILHIPHAGLELPKGMLGGLTVSRERVRDDALYLADMYCDELYAHAGIAMIAARYSRYICDVERFPDDADEPMAAKGQGLFYTRLHDGTEFRSAALRGVIKETVYDAHHAELSRAVRGVLESHPRCLIIDGHSFPRDLDGRDDLPDVCIGVSEYHTPEVLANTAIELARGRGYSVRVNDPFAGALVPQEYYGVDKRVSSIMIELNRRLYMEDKSGGYNKSAGFAETKSFCSSMVEALAAYCKG